MYWFRSVRAESHAYFDLLAQSARARGVKLEYRKRTEGGRTYRIGEEDANKLPTFYSDEHYPALPLAEGVAFVLDLKATLGDFELGRNPNIWSGDWMEA